jgi:hypothetical protein
MHAGPCGHGRIRCVGEQVCASLLERALMARVYSSSQTGCGPVLEGERRAVLYVA